MMYTINRIDRYPSVIFPGTPRKVKEVNKDEKNKQQKQQEKKKEETFQDIFEKSRKEEKPTY